MGIDLQAREMAAGRDGLAPARLAPGAFRDRERAGEGAVGRGAAAVDGDGVGRGGEAREGAGCA